MQLSVRIVKKSILKHARQGESVKTTHFTFSHKMPIKKKIKIPPPRGMKWMFA